MRGTNIVNALDHLRRASELITVAGQMNSVSLSEAAGHFWSATFDEEHWPLALRVDSTSLKAKLLASGTIHKTVQSLDAEHLALLTEELARFCFNATDELAQFPHIPEPRAVPRIVSGSSFSSAS